MFPIETLCLFPIIAGIISGLVIYMLDIPILDTEKYGWTVEEKSVFVPFTGDKLPSTDGDGERYICDFHGITVKNIGLLGRGKAEIFSVTMDVFNSEKVKIESDVPCRYTSKIFEVDKLFAGNEAGNKYERKNVVVGAGEKLHVLSMYNITGQSNFFLFTLATDAIPIFPQYKSSLFDIMPYYVHFKVIAQRKKMDKYFIFNVDKGRLKIQEIGWLKFKNAT